MVARPSVRDPSRSDPGAGYGEIINRRSGRAPIADAPTDPQLSPQVHWLVTPIACTGGDEGINRGQHAFAGMAITVGVNGVGMGVNGLPQLRRSRQRTLDRRLELRRIVDVDQLWAGLTVLECHHRFASEQEFAERGR